MSKTLRTIRRRIVAVLAVPLLLGSVTAAAPAPAPAPDVEARAVADLAYRDTFYSDASYTTVVGVGYGYCDGSFSMDWGYATSYKLRRHYPCPDPEF